MHAGTGESCQHFCTKCGRVLLCPSPFSEWWLVSEDGRTVRCPQHITDWAMRQAKVRRTKATYKWKEEARANDIAPTNILIEPFYN
jgi:hypothetical protein